MIDDYTAVAVEDDAPAPQVYPKALYHREPDGSIHPHVVASKDDHDALGDGWYESPADCPPAPAPKE